MPKTARHIQKTLLSTCAALSLAGGGALVISDIAPTAHASLPVQTETATLVPTSATKAPGGNVHASIVLTQTGGTLAATGTATGMDPTGVYLSVLYGYGSNATTCTPDGTLNFGQMLLGIWELTPSGTRVLVAPPKENAGTPGVTLSQVKYVSIRETSSMLVQSTAQQLGQTFLLAACGTINPALP